MRSFLTLAFLCFHFLSFSQISVIELEEKRVPEPITRDSVVDQWNQSQPGYQKLPNEAKQLLYWTNYARNNPAKFWDSAIAPVLAVFKPLNVSEAISLKKDLLRVGKLPMFVLNETLVATAQSHASDIGGKKAPLSHTSTNGADFGTRIKKVGIRYCANENISLSSQSILLSLILLYLDIRLPDLGHRKTLLDMNLKEIGIGSSRYGSDQYFLVQDFACAQ
jgi:hypothetical protein